MPIKLFCGHNVCNSCFNDTGKKCSSCKASSTYSTPNLAIMNRLENPYNYILRFLTLGDSFVGKTNLLSAFTEENFEFSFASLSTNAVDMRSKKMTIQDKSVHIQLIDTAGQERYRSVNQQACRDIHAVFLVYDITSEASFASIDYWMKFFKDTNKIDCEFILVGNKKDLEGQRVVDIDVAMEYAKNNNMFYFETSARTNINVQEVFIQTAERVLKNYKRAKSISSQGSGMTLSSQVSSKKHKKISCIQKFFGIFSCFQAQQM